MAISGFDDGVPRAARVRYLRYGSDEEFTTQIWLLYL